MKSIKRSLPRFSDCVVFVSGVGVSSKLGCAEIRILGLTASSFLCCTGFQAEVLIIQS